MLDLHLSVRRYLPNFDELEGAVLPSSKHRKRCPPGGFVYRFIAALAELGILERFAAILMGYPKAQFCGREAPEGRDTFIAHQQTAVKKALKDYDSHLPVVFHMNFGHTDPQMVIPNGGTVSIDGTKRTIHFN